MTLYPIDLLNIRDKDLRKQHYEKLLKNADEHKSLLLEAYMELQKRTKRQIGRNIQGFKKFFHSILLNPPVIFITMKRLKLKKIIARFRN